MDDVVRLLVLLAMAGAALTLMGGAAIWYMDEGRRVRRGLRAVLKGDTHGLLVARGRGRGVGFNFSSNQVAVAWDSGAWCLVYRLDELLGAEVIVDGVVVGRAHRGEARRALDRLDGAEQRVALRLLFDDPGKPDFVLDLWLPQDEGRRDGLSPPEAIEEANRWIARVEALLRRDPGRQPSAPIAKPAERAPTPARNDVDYDEDEGESIS
jgi:hypothetical protein